MSKTRLIKILKWTLGIILSCVLLISGALMFFKDDIIRYVIQEVNKKLDAKVSVSEVDLTFWGSFPNLSVDFNQVYIEDQIDSIGKSDTLLYTDRIRLRFNPIDVWNEDYKVKEIDIYPGTLKLRVDSLGNPNYNIFKESSDSTSSEFQFKLEEVRLQNLRCVYSNAISNQRYATHIDEMALNGDFSDQHFTLNANAELFVQEARSGQVALIRNKPAEFDLNIDVNQQTGQFTLSNAQLLVANLPFLINGKVTTDSINFNINASALKLTDVVNNLAFSQLDHVKTFEGTGTVGFNLDVKGNREIDEPASIACQFNIQNGQLTEPVKKQKISNIVLNGAYQNNGKPEDELLALNNIQFTTASGPFSGQLKITQFEAPHFDGAAIGDINLNVIHSLFRIPHLESLNGNLGVNTQFSVQAKKQPNEQLLYDILKCEGQAEFKNISFQLLDDKRVFKQLYGNVFLRNDQAGFKDVRLNLGSSDIAINGVFENVVAYFKKQSDLRTDITISSKHIEIADLGSTVKEEQIKDARTYMLPDGIKGSVDLNIADLSYEGFHFELITGLLNINNRQLHFPDIRFRNAGALAQGTLFIHENSPEMFQVATSLSSSNIQLKQLFKDWNDFKQDVIRSEHIDGHAAISLQLTAPFDLRSGVIFKAVQSEVQLKVSNGRLKNVETFETIVKSLNETTSAKLAIGKENIKHLSSKLKDLKFETMENTLIIKNGIIHIPSMEIRSSALNLDASGTHSFDNEIDYKFSFRFRDLKQTKQEEYGNVVDDGTGIHVYMRMHGNLDNPIIEWDKDAKKQDRQEYNQQEKENLKGMLKSEFGMFGKDSTVNNYSKQVKPRETLEIITKPDTSSVEDFIEKNKREDKPVFKKLRAWEKEAKKQQPVLEVDDDDDF